MHDGEEPTIDPDVDARRWRALAVLCLSLMIVMVGNSSLNLALPALASDLGASTSEMQWMVDAYALVFAGLLFPAGAIGDRFGRKRALQGGLVVFLVAAVAGALAGSAAFVVVARAIMGAAAAFVMPSTLSILANLFPAGERGRAIGLWAGIAAGGAALGPTVTGLVLEHFWWGAVFLINVPVIVLALAAGWVLVPESRDPARRPLDVGGVLLALLGVGALVYAIIQAPEHGWASPATIAAFAAAALALAGFVVRERTARYPMLDLALFADRRFTVASVAIAIAFFAMFGTWFVTAQYVQLVLGYSPLGAGLLMTPFALVMMVIAPRAPGLAARFGPANVAAVGLAGVALGLAAFRTLDVGDHGAELWVGLLPMAVGMAITSTPLTTLVMSAVPASRAGVASAMNDTDRELGGALGVAVLGSLVTTRFGGALGPATAGLPDDARAAAATGLPGALRVAGELPAGAGPGLAEAARAAFVDGLHSAALVGAGTALVAAIGARLLLPRSATEEPATTEADVAAEEVLEAA
jgi:EmrB/QacA subfamily drug resistance transporter